jgi:hypothetical protein
VTTAGFPTALTAFREANPLKHTSSNSAVKEPWGYLLAGTIEASELSLLSHQDIWIEKMRLRHGGESVAAPPEEPTRVAGERQYQATQVAERADTYSDTPAQKRTPENRHYMLRIPQQECCLAASIICLQKCLRDPVRQAM